MGANLSVDKYSKQRNPPPPPKKKEKKKKNQNEKKERNRKESQRVLQCEVHQKQYYTIFFLVQTQYFYLLDQLFGAQHHKALTPESSMHMAQVKI